MQRVMIIAGAILAVLAFIAVGLIFFINTAPQFGGKPTKQQKEKYAASPHYRDGRFYNSVETPLRNPDMSFAATMREFLKDGPDREPGKPLPIEKLNASHFSQIDSHAVSITWLGHSAVLIEFYGHIFLADPMLGQYASPVSFLGPKRFNKELALDPYDIPHVDAIILSHDHYDHLDYGAIKILHEKTDRFFVPLGVAPHLLHWGVRADKIVELDWWQSSAFHGDVEFIATPARHFSGRRYTDNAKTFWASWMIRNDSRAIYFGGDSGYGPHFKEIGDKYGPFDVTMLENGAYNIAWPFVHMMPEQTAQAHLDLQGKVLLPIHWGQFNLSTHAWNEPIERLTVAAQEKNITLVTPQIGETFVVGKK